VRALVSVDYNCVCVVCVKLPKKSLKRVETCFHVSMYKRVEETLFKKWFLWHHKIFVLVLGIKTIKNPSDYEYLQKSA
jgi:hypothetical protein